MKPTKGHIRVRFKEDNVIIIDVEDDRIGRKKAGELQPRKESQHKSLSTSITVERIQVLNKTVKNKITLEIRDLKDATNKPSGTRATIEIPLN